MSKSNIRTGFQNFYHVALQPLHRTLASPSVHFRLPWRCPRVQRQQRVLVYLTFRTRVQAAARLHVDASHAHIQARRLEPCSWRSRWQRNVKAPRGGPKEHEQRERDAPLFRPHLRTRTTTAYAVLPSLLALRTLRAGVFKKKNFNELVGAEHEDDTR